MRRKHPGNFLVGNVTKCKFCGKEIIWHQAKSGKWYAMDVLYIAGFDQNTGKYFGYAHVNIYKLIIIKMKKYFFKKMY